MQLGSVWHNAHQTGQEGNDAGDQTDQQGDAPHVMLAACAAPEWKEKGGFIMPPPQLVSMGQAYELTLIPFAGTNGRIAAFPCVRE